jgi:hypothetical protein
VTVTIRHSDALALNLAEYTGSVLLSELRALADFAASRVRLLKCDCLSIVEADAEFSALGMSDLDALFAYYGVVFAPLDMQIFRRSAWICRSAGAQAYVSYWLGGRDTRQEMRSDVRQFDDEAQAGQWLLLNRAEIALVRERTGFLQIAAFDGATETVHATG